MRFTLLALLGVAVSALPNPAELAEKPCTHTITTTKKVAKTPYTTVTSTVSTKVTSAAPSSGTLTLTSTAHVNSTSTINTDTTTMTTTTQTISVSTYTIPAPSGFQPVQDTLQGASYDGSGGDSPVDSNVVEKRAAKCHTTVKTIVHTTSTLPTHTKTATTTSTSTVYTTPLAGTTTSTVTETSTITTVVTTATVTNTATSTTTNYQTTTTVWAACATNNFADVWEGNNITALHYNPASPYQQLSTYLYPNVGSAYVCCHVALQDSNNNAVWEYIIESGDCQTSYLVNGAPRSQSSSDWGIVNGYPTPHRVVGNSAYGLIDQVYQDN